MAYFQQLLVAIGHLLIQQFSMQIEISKNEDAYRWIIKWISQKTVAKLSSKLTVVVESKLSRNAMWKKMAGQSDPDAIVSKTPPKIVFQPGPGLHILMYKGRLFFLWRSIIEGSSANNFTSLEYLNIYILGRNRTIIEEFIGEAMEYCIAQDRGQTIIYTQDTTYGTGWARSISRPQRSLESVILDTNIGEQLVSDAQEFFKNENWYRTLGVPYRRSYLLHGKPGCGKTSFVSALAGKLNLNVCVLVLSNKNMNDSTVNQLLNEAPQGSLILLEDIDVAFPSREHKKKSENNIKLVQNMMGWSNESNITFSGILNAIDGIASQEGRLFVMTTNYYDRLDPALIRPGRADRVIFFQLASKNQIRNMFLKFYPGEKDMAQKFADAIGENRVSMAMLQGHFLSYKEEPLKAFTDVTKLVEQIENMEMEEKKRKLEEEEEEKKEKENAAKGPEVAAQPPQNIEELLKT